MRIKNKLHYTLKYLFIAFPILELVFIMIMNKHTITEFTSIFSLIDNGVLITHSLGGGNIGAPIGELLSNIFSLNVEVGYWISGIVIWITGVYIVDILVDLLTMLPKICHALVERFDL